MIDTQKQEFNDKLEAERETPKKELEELKYLYGYVRVRVVLYELYDIYCVNFVLCSCVFFYDVRDQ